MSKNFRIWDTKTQTFSYFGLREAFGRIPADIGDECICQSMGEYDKNKVEIYEGDIVKVQTQNGGYNYFIVKFGSSERTMATGASVEIIGFYFKRIKPLTYGFHYFSIVNNWCGRHDLEVTEVIGNIFQNPELLK